MQTAWPPFENMRVAHHFPMLLASITGTRWKLSLKLPLALFYSFCNVVKEAYSNSLLSGGSGFLAGFV